jgi:4-amino-4-deoxy-L-arabinose transferase-like glycosyltransferase
LWALALILVLAACLRLYGLLPVQRGLRAAQDYDEGVWDSTAQLMLQGHLPYRDFFATLPPVGIYLLAAVLRLVYVPWGSSLGLMATRYASVVYGLATGVLVYLLGRRLAGRAAGLLAAGLLAVDGMVIGMDRMAMLEPPLNLFSVLALWAYLGAFDRASDEARGQRLAALAGVLAAVASLAKTPGMVVILALVSVSLLRRRWREALILAASFAASWLALSAYFLAQCPGEFVKQVYLFQFLRPADGVVRRLSRLYDVWHYGQAWLSVRLGTAGALLVGWLALRRREAQPWLVVLAWAGYTGLFMMANSSYYPQYYVQLAVPLCLLGGGLLDARLWPGGRQRWGIPKTRCLTLGGVALTLVLLAGLVSGQLLQQPAQIATLLSQTDSIYVDVADQIRRNSAADARVLVFEPNYAFLASRPPAGAQVGHFLVDSYGEMLYVNLGIPERSLPELAYSVLMAKKGQLQATFWGAPAQQQALAAFEQAAFVVVDGRARYQLQPQTLAAIQARSEEVFSSGIASLRQRR